MKLKRDAKTGKISKACALMAPAHAKTRELKRRNNPAHPDVPQKLYVNPTDNDVSIHTSSSTRLKSKNFCSMSTIIKQIEAVTQFAKILVLDNRLQHNLILQDRGI